MVPTIAIWAIIPLILNEHLSGDFLKVLEGQEAGITSFLDQFRAVMHLQLFDSPILVPLAAAACSILALLLFALTYVSWKTHILVLTSKTSQSARTSGMQFALFRCITVQSVLLVVFYHIPVSLLIVAVLFPAIPHSSIVPTCCLGAVVTYPPLSYVIIMALIPQFRSELFKILKNLKRSIFGKPVKPVVIFKGSA